MSQSDPVSSASSAAEQKESAAPSLPSRPSHLRVESSAAATSAATFALAASSPTAVAPQSPSSPSSGQSYRRALQSIRAQDLEQEAKLNEHQTAAEDQFWLKQEERLNMCVRRAALGAASARDLHTYLKRSSKLLSTVADSLAGLGSFGVAGETGTMRVACMSIDIVRKSSGSYLTELNGRVFSDSIKAAAETADQAAHIASAYEGVGLDSLKQLKAQRARALEAWSAYLSDTRDRHRAELSGRPLKSDPFLLCRAYEAERYELHTSEAKFVALTASLLRDLEASEAKRIALTKSTLIDNLSANKAVLEHTVKFTDNALLTVRAIDPAADIKEFVTAADLYLPPGAAPAPSVSAATAASLAAAAASSGNSGSSRSSPDALLAHAQTEQAADALAKETPVVAFMQPPPARDPRALARLYAHEIEKEGPLERQGSIMKSHWKPTHAVLTASGFLHLFTDKSKQRVHSSHSLSDCAAESGDAAHPHLHTVKLTFASKGGLFSSPTTVFLKAANDDEQGEWVMQMQKHCAKTTASASGQSVDAAPAAAVVVAPAPNSNGSAPASPVAVSAPAPAATSASAAPSPSAAAAAPAAAEHQQQPAPAAGAAATEAEAAK